jgi:hypothetical protein
MKSISVSAIVILVLASIAAFAQQPEDFFGNTEPGPSGHFMQEQGNARALPEQLLPSVDRGITGDGAHPQTSRGFKDGIRISCRKSCPPDRPAPLFARAVRYYQTGEKRRAVERRR